MDPGLLSDLRDGVDKARAAGIDVYLDDVSERPRRRRRARPSTRRASRCGSPNVVTGIPGLKHVIVGNESNLNLFWLPQFGPRGPGRRPRRATKQLLAKTYDTVKRAAPKVEVIGGALAHSGTDKPEPGATPTRRRSSSSTWARPTGPRSGRSRSWTRLPTTRTWSAPTCRPHSGTWVGKTLTIADYGKLVSVLKPLRSTGRRQKGSTLPLVYDEFGVESAGARRQLRVQRERAGDHAPGTETTQARYYEEGFRLAALPADRPARSWSSRLIDETSSSRASSPGSTTPTARRRNRASPPWRPPPALPVRGVSGCESCSRRRRLSPGPHAR